MSHITKVESSIEIKAPIETVFAYFSNPKNQEKIFVDSKFKIEDVSKHPLGVGTKYRISGVIGKRKVKPHWHEFIEFEKNSKIVSHEVKGGGGVLKSEDQIFLFRTLSEGMKLTISQDYEPPYSVIGKLFDKIMVKDAFQKFYPEGGTKGKRNLRGDLTICWW